MPLRAPTVCQRPVTIQNRKVWFVFDAYSTKGSGSGSKAQYLHSDQSWKPHCLPITTGYYDTREAAQIAVNVWKQHHDHEEKMHSTFVNTKLDGIGQHFVIFHNGDYSGFAIIRELDSPGGGTANPKIVGVDKVVPIDALLEFAAAAREYKNEESKTIEHKLNCGNEGLQPYDTRLENEALAVKDGSILKPGM